MYQNLIQQIKTALLLLLIFTIITGIIYPVSIGGIAQLLYPYKANGSLIEQGGKVVGSKLIGQQFQSEAFFWGRPSGTIPYPYNSEKSSGSNMATGNHLFLEKVQQRVNHFRKFDTKGLIPVDLVTASGSGLDPDISLLAAIYQVPRIAKARNLSEQTILTLIDNRIKNRTFGILGEPCVNVLELNLALEKLRIYHAKSS